MKKSKASLRAHEIVPLADRLRYMQIFRLVSAALVSVYALVAPLGMQVEAGNVARWTGAYLGFSLVGEAVWRLRRKRGITLFGAMIIADGFYLAWASYMTGSSSSPLRYLIILHIIAVTLLASYRTGLKLALWHSLLLFAVHDLQEAGILRPIGEGPLPGSGSHRLAVFVTVTWAVAIATATFSAVNERELRRRKFDLEALARMTRALQATAGSTAVADRLLDGLTDAFGFGRALALRNHNGCLTLMSARGTEPTPDPASCPRLDAVIEAAFQARRTFLVPGLDPAADRYLSTLLPSATNLIVVPLLGEGEPLGVVVLEHGARRGSRIEHRVLSILEQFAAHAALSLERCRLDAELRHAQKLESVGQLAAGIAHEINTPIQFVGDNVRFLKDAFGDLTRLMDAYRQAEGCAEPETAWARAGELATEVDAAFLAAEVPGAIDQTLEGVERVADIVRAMKAFAHPSGEDKVLADVNEAVRNTLVVANNELKYVAEVVSELGELPLVPCHLGDVNQVLLNLVVNAAHAVAEAVGEGGGRDTITVRTRREGDTVVIQVADTGAGIPPEIAERVFEPFFTTKEVGKGTGHGLALAHSLVVNRHGGTITFDSQPGAGTTFTVRLPIGDSVGDTDGETKRRRSQAELAAR